MTLSFRTILFLCTAVAIRADSLPTAVTLAECTDRTLIDDPTSCSLSGFDASASGSLTLFPFVSLTAQSNSGPANGLFNPGAGSFVSARYSFRVVGGNLGDVVPILFTTNLTSNASSFSHALGFAEAVLHTGFGDTSKVVCTNGSCGTTDTSFSGTFGWFANSGESGDTIQLEVEASSGDSPIAESANASADPFIFVDPSFAEAANYSIELSLGVGNGLPVATPEPRTVGLMAAFLVLLVICSPFRSDDLRKS
jgi:hypothetical protein